MPLRTFGTVVSLALIPLIARADPVPDDPQAALHRGADARDQNRAEIARLLAQATTAPTAAERGNAAFAAASAATDGVANVITAIDSAIRLVDFNVRHADTTGFKAVRATVSAGGGPPAQVINVEQGSLNNTGRNLDLGISGNGWFRVKIGDGAAARFAYTRNGNIFVTNDGHLVVGMKDGFPLDPPVVIPAGTANITIAEDGQVTCVLQGQTQAKAVGQLQLAIVPLPERLVFEEPGLYLADERRYGVVKLAIPGEAGAGSILSGFLEASNTDLPRERVRLRFLLDWREAVAEAMRGLPQAPAPTTRP